IEAFASGVPVVATAVGGVAEAAGDAALLIPPRDASAAVQALERIAAGPELRTALIDRGLELARGQTLDSESSRVAAFISSPDGAGPRRALPAASAVGLTRWGAVWACHASHRLASARRSPRAYAAARAGVVAAQIVKRPWTRMPLWVDTLIVGCEVISRR